MSDKRHHKRFRLEAFDVDGKVILATKVEIIDISMGGLAIKADRRLNIGNAYVIRLEDREKVISLKGVVVWSLLSGNTAGPDGDVIPVYTAGMELKDLSAEKAVDLLNFIEHNKKKEVSMAGDHRSNLRFHIEAPGKTILNFQTDYRVQTISLGGMLIESKCAIDVGTKVPMRLSLPDREPINFFGRIVSGQIARKGGRAHYAVGIEFLGLSDKDSAILARFVDSLADSANPDGKQTPEHS